jgi:hypothetical protein
MAKRLRVRNAKRKRDKARAYSAGKAPKRHKVAVERAFKMRRKRAYRQT